MRRLRRLLAGERGQSDWVEFTIELVLFLMLGTAAWALFVAARDQLMLNQAASMVLSSERVYGCYTNVADQDLKAFFQSQGMPPSAIDVTAQPTSAPALWGDPVGVEVQADVAMPVFGWTGWTMKLGATRADVAQPVAALPSGVVCQSPSMTASVAPGSSGTGPGASVSQPGITDVQFTGHGQSLGVMVYGYGFGTAPEAMPYSGNTSDFALIDNTRGGWEAGYGQNAVTLDYASWQPDEIVVSGFSGAYGGGWQVHHNDSVTIRVWNPQSGQETSWTGTLP